MCDPSYWSSPNQLSPVLSSSILLTSPILLFFSGYSSLTALVSNHSLPLSVSHSLSNSLLCLPSFLKRCSSFYQECLSKYNALWFSKLISSLPCLCLSSGNLQHNKAWSNWEKAFQEWTQAKKANYLHIYALYIERRDSLWQVKMFIPF